MIRFGPAGIPLSCKGRTLKDGLEEIHISNLSAMEIPLVRVGLQEQPPEEEDVGKTICELPDDFIIEILRDDELIDDVNAPIEEDDILVRMLSPITKSFGNLAPMGHMAKRMDIELSMHTPNYMDLGGDEELAMSCMDNIRRAAKIMNAMDGDMVVTTLGLYQEGQDRDEVDDNIYANLKELARWWKDMDIKPRLGIEMTGHEDVFGSKDQVLELCKKIKGLVPVINFHHYHSRTDGSLLETDNFIDLIEEVEPYYKKGNIHMEFSGVEYADGNEKLLTAIKKGSLKFEPLSEALMEINPQCTIISPGPLLEHDAVYMKIIYERVLSRRASKELKRRKLEESAAAGE